IRCSRGAVRIARTLRREGLRQLIHDVFDAHLAGVLDVLCGDGRNGADALEVGGHDARARHDDGGYSGLIAGGLLLRAEWSTDRCSCCRARDERGTDCPCNLRITGHGVPPANGVSRSYMRCPRHTLSVSRKRLFFCKVTPRAGDRNLTLRRTIVAAVL